MKSKNPIYPRLLSLALLLSLLVLIGCKQQESAVQSAAVTGVSELSVLALSKAEYQDRLEGFWLGQCIANWTGLVTEMDKIGGEGPHGEFYTRENWGQPDQPSIWGQGIPSELSSTIDWVLVDEGGTWGADDDTDIEYMYQHLLLENNTSILSGEQQSAAQRRI